jgi:hypothetical protein
MTENLKTGQRITWRSLTFQLLAIVVFPLIVLLLIITFGSTTLHENAMRDLVSQRDERAARMASTAIEDQVQKRANEVRAVAGQVSLAPAGEAGEVLNTSVYLQADFDAGLAVVGKNGQVAAVQGDPSIWDRQKKVVIEGLNALVADPKPGVYISTVLSQPGQQSPLMIAIAYAVGEQYAVAGAFYTHPLAEHVFANVFTPDQEASVAVVASGGGIVYQKGFDSPGEMVSQHAGVADALAGRNGTTYIDVENSEHVVAYSPGNGLPHLCSIQHISHRL